MRDICLRLIVIVIRHKVLDGVFGEKLPEFCAKLRCKRFVVGKHERGAVELFDDACHRKGLARAGDSQQNLFLNAVFNTAHQLLNSLRLVAHGGIWGYQFEPVHTESLLYTNRCIISQKYKNHKAV